MTLPLQHNAAYMRLIAQQLWAQRAARYNAKGESYWLARSLMGGCHDSKA